MKFFQFISVPFYIDDRDNWWIVNAALCVLVEDDKEIPIVACYPEICCLQRKDWLCPKEDQGVKVR